MRDKILIISICVIGDVFLIYSIYRDMIEEINLLNVFMCFNVLVVGIFFNLIAYSHIKRDK